MIKFELPDGTIEEVSEERIDEFLANNPDAKRVEEEQESPDVDIEITQPEVEEVAVPEIEGEAKTGKMADTIEIPKRTIDIGSDTIVIPEVYKKFTPEELDDTDFIEKIPSSTEILIKDLEEEEEIENNYEKLDKDLLDQRTDLARSRENSDNPEEIDEQIKLIDLAREGREKEKEEALQKLYNRGGNKFRAAKNLLKDPIDEDGEAIGMYGLESFLPNVARIFGATTNPYDQEVPLIELDNEIIKDIFDGMSEVDIQRLEANVMSLSEREKLITASKMKFYEEKLPIYGSQIEELNQALSSLTQGTGTLPLNATEEEKVQYNEIISELKQVTSDAQLTAGKYGVDLATGIIKNNFQATDDVKAFNERYGVGKPKESLAEDLMSRFNSGIISTVLKINPFTLGMWITGEAGSELMHLLGVGDEYNILDEWTDVIEEVAKYNTFGRGEERKPIAEFGKATGRDYAQLAADILPYSLGIIAEARKGKLTGYKRNIGNVIGGKSGRLNGLSAKQKNQILVADAAFRVGYLQNLSDAKEQGLDGANAKLYAFTLSFGTAVSAPLGFESRFTAPIFSKAITGNFANTLKKAATIKASKEASKSLLKTYAGEFLQEEFEVAVDAGTKYAFGLSLPGYEESVTQQKELIAGTVMLSTAFGAPRATQVYGINKQALYADVIKQSSELFESFDTYLKVAKDPKTINQLEQGKEFVRDIVRAAKVAPENITADQLDFLIQKQRLLEKKKNTDSAFHGPIDEQIKELDAKIAEGDIVKGKELVEKRIQEGVAKYAEKLGSDYKRLSQKEVDEFIEGLDADSKKELKGSGANKQFGFFYVDPKTKKTSFIVNTDVSKKNNVITTDAHEALHAIVYETVKNNPQAAENLGQALTNELAKIDLRLISDTNFGQRLKGYLLNPKLSAANSWEEALTLFSEATLTGDIVFEENLFTKIGDIYRAIARGLGLNITFNSGRDVYNFIKDYNKSLLKGKASGAIIRGGKKGFKGKLTKAETKVKPSESFKFSTKEQSAVDNLVGPKDEDGNYTMTKTEWDKRGINKAYEALVVGDMLDPLINKGVFGKQIQGQSRAMFVEGVKDEISDLLRKFNPEQNNSLSGWVNSLLFKKKGTVLKKGKKAKTVSLDKIEATITAEEDVKEDTQALESELRKTINIDKKAVLDAVNKIFKGKLPALTDKKFKTAFDIGSRNELTDKVMKLLGEDDATYNAFIEKNINNIIKNIDTKSLVKIERTTPASKRIFTKLTGRRLSPKAVDKAIAEGKLSPTVNRLSGPDLYEKRQPTLKEVQEFFNPPAINIKTGKKSGLKGTRKLGLASIIAENVARDAAPELLRADETIEKIKEIQSLTGKQTKGDIKAIINNELNRDPELKFSTKAFADQALELGNMVAEGELLDLFDIDTRRLFDSKLEKKYNPQVQQWIFELFAAGSLQDQPTKRFFQNIITSPDIPKSLKKLYAEEGSLTGSENGKKWLVKNVKTIAKDLGKDKMNTLGLDFLGFFNRALDPAARKETRTSVEARKKVREKNKKLKEENKPLLPTPKIIYEENVVGEFYNEYQKLKQALGKLPSSPETKKALESIRLMNKKFPLFKEIDKIRKLKSLTEKLDALRKLAPEIEAANKANIQLATDVSTTINKLYREGKIKGLSVLYLYQLQTNAVGGLRALTSLDYITLEEGSQDGQTMGEHLAPNANTMSRLAELTLDPNLTLEGSNLLIADTYQTHSQWHTDKALTKIVDDKGGKNNPSNEKRILFLPVSDQGNVYHISGVPYRRKIVADNILKIQKKKASKFNNKALPPVVKLSGDYTNQMVLDEMAELDKEQAVAQMKFSKSQDLSGDFNKILEKTTGIGADKVYSDVKAQVVGANKGKFDFFVPPSAEDFVGLLYKTLSKGKLGDTQMAWYKKNLLDPFGRAMDNISRDRIALMNDFKTLKKDLKIVPKNLKKKLPGEPFTQEHAIRTYIWNKQGMTPDGMSKQDIKDLSNFVANNPELVLFADQLIELQKGDQYPAPKIGWLAGSITTDLIDGINTIKRKKYLEQWQYNADEIFSKANLNKLEAAYGKGYRTALESILKRMRTGRNREFTSDSLTGRVTDWLTNSIGAIMFFNTRSAVLQTISAVNFINWEDNNIFAAGKAFANQPQFWSDFKNLFNSDFLVDRRNGLKLNVNEADIADMAKKGGVRGVISEMLRVGFLPTQIADSFAIASGGSTFYRNRINTYIKQGMSKADAENQAFLDFRELAEEAQQSSRPDRISAQQAGPLGRIILAFANTPMQYTRLIKKAALDLKNGRGNSITNISKIFYYGFAQNLLFNAMQQALFAMGFGDDEEETEKREEKYTSIANSMADSILRGAGIGGAIFSVLKNTGLKLAKEADKKSPKFQDVLTKEIVQLSPPISSKLSKLKAAGRSYSWNKKEMMEKGFSLDNPAYLAAGQVIAATTNIPLDRAFKKIDNIRKASSSDYEAWARIAMLAGWADWELGVKKPTAKKKKSKKKKKRKRLKP